MPSGLYPGTREAEINTGDGHGRRLSVALRVTGFTSPYAGAAIVPLPGQGVIQMCRAAAVAFLALGLVACQTSTGPSTFNRSEVGTARTVERGTIRALRDVEIQNNARTVPTATGAVLGGIAGSTLGGGRRANAAGAVAGAAAGGAIGSAVSRSSHAGVEITVELESGSTIAVTQDGTSNEFRVGDRVQVSSDGTYVRVTR